MLQHHYHPTIKQQINGASWGIYHVEPKTLPDTQNMQIACISSGYTVAGLCCQALGASPSPSLGLCLLVELRAHSNTPPQTQAADMRWSGDQLVEPPFSALPEVPTTSPAAMHIKVPNRTGDTAYELECGACQRWAFFKFLSSLIESERPISDSSSCYLRLKTHMLSMWQSQRRL